METFGTMIARRRSGKESPEDFLQSMLRRDAYPADEKLQDSEIMDNLLTLIIAGQTTTAAAMMWSVKFLDENKDIQERLRVRIYYLFLTPSVPKLEKHFALVEFLQSGQSTSKLSLNY